MHDLKMVPKRKLSDSKPKREGYTSALPYKNKKKKKIKGLFARVMDEAWDVVEDIFD
ncbi:hypothetical protein [Ruegeria arenilitoris]|uniref:hypothetical protein n=1 Tax=Ruegeria arenilitoris TaxID=1173585 RepID=UPI003464C363